MPLHRRRQRLDEYREADLLRARGELADRRRDSRERRQRRLRDALRALLAAISRITLAGGPMNTNPLRYRLREAARSR